MRLTGLVARPELNGRCGTVFGPGGTGGRWEVRLEGSAEGSPTVGVKDSNLELLRTKEQEIEAIMNEYTDELGEEQMRPLREFLLNAPIEELRQYAQGVPCSKYF